MLVYVAAAYSSVADKDASMKAIMRFTGEYMLTNRGSALVSPLFNHYSLDQVPTLGTDWIFWKGYSTTLLRKCDEMIVLVTNDTASSTGVRAEVELATELGINITYFDMDKYITLSKEINDFASANNE